MAHGATDWEALTSAIREEFERTNGMSGTRPLSRRPERAGDQYANGVSNGAHANNGSPYGSNRQEHRSLRGFHKRPREQSTGYSASDENFSVAVRPPEVHSGPYPPNGSSKRSHNSRQPQISDWSLDKRIRIRYSTLFLLMALAFAVATILMR